MRCSDIDRMVDCFVDCELAEPERLEFEAHLAECAACRRLTQEQASWKSLLRAAGPQVRAPERLRQRLAAALDVEERRQRESDRLWGFFSRGSSGVRRHAPAAIVLIAVLSLVSPSLLPGFLRLGESPMIQASILTHQRNLPPEITGRPEIIRSWFDGKVPFAVRTPPLGPMASLLGGRLVSLGSHEAAHLIYDVGGRKVSVFVFDPQDLAIGAPRREVIGRHEIFLEEQRGYNVAIFRAHGVGYAITAALDEPELLQVISPAIPR